MRLRPLHPIALLLLGFSTTAIAAEQRFIDRKLYTIAIPGLQGRPALQDCIPAVDAGQLFLQDGLRVYGFELQSAKPIKGWRESSPDSGCFALAEIKGDPDLKGWAMRRLHALAISADSVLAVLGEFWTGARRSPLST